MASRTVKRIAKDVHRLTRTLTSVTNGQAEVTEVCWNETLDFICVDIKPTDGLYKGTSTMFKMHFHHEMEYPEEPPVVDCLTKIYHPNMNHDDGVCVSLLSEWEPHNDLVDIIQALLFLLYNPNFEDPLTTLADSEEEYLDSIKLYIDGTLDKHRQPNFNEDQDECQYEQKHDFERKYFEDQKPGDILRRTEDILFKRQSSDECGDIPPLKRQRRLYESTAPSSLRRTTTVLVKSTNWDVDSDVNMVGDDDDDEVSANKPAVKRIGTVPHSRMLEQSTIVTNDWIQKQKEAWAEKQRAKLSYKQPNVLDTCHIHEKALLYTGQHLLL